MTDFKLSSKMHLFIIISGIIIAIGLAVGIVCQCLGTGFFHFSDDYRSYQSITVTYYVTDYTKDDVEKIAEECMNGTKAYAVKYADHSVTYQFSENAEGIEKIAESINAKLSVNDNLSTAEYNNGKTALSGSMNVERAAITVAVIIVFAFFYMLARYSLSAALSSVLADLHNLMLYLALLAITRIPVGSLIVALSVLVVLVTVILTVLYNASYKKLSKQDEAFRELTALDQIDRLSLRFYKPVAVVLGCVACVALIIAILTMIGTLSMSLLMPCLALALVCVTTFYGSVLFTPSVSSRFFAIAAKTAAKKSK